MKHFPKELEKRVGYLNESSGKRTLSLRKGIDFSSNDYLGFADDPLLKQYVIQCLGEIPLGSTASRLLRGHLRTFDQAEETLSRFCSRESAVLFPSGYQANVGLLSAILRPTDVIFSDQLN